MTASDFEYLQYPDGRVWAVPLSISRARRPEATGQQAVAPCSASPAAPPPARIEPEAPPSFGARLKSILALPEATGKQRRAVALAASCMVTPKAAAVILAGLPLDEDGDVEFPEGDVEFPEGDAPLEPDAPHILGILRSREAASRMTQAVAIAVDTKLDVAAALALLARLPEEPRVQRTPTIAERAALLPEIGWFYEEPVRTGARASWAAAMEQAGVRAKSTTSSGMGGKP